MTTAKTKISGPSYQAGEPCSPWSAQTLYMAHQIGIANNCHSQPDVCLKLCIPSTQMVAITRAGMTLLARMRIGTPEAVFWSGPLKRRAGTTPRVGTLRFARDNATLPRVQPEWPHLAHQIGAASTVLRV